MASLTWESRPEAVRGSAGGDASDDAVQEEADSLSFGAGQEEDSSPWKVDERGRMGKQQRSRARRAERLLGFDTSSLGATATGVIGCSQASQETPTFPQSEAE